MAATTTYGNERVDTDAILQDDGDSSKKMRFELSAISTATTRVVNMGDADADLALVLSETASGTNPTVIPVAADPDTGVGHIGADQLNLIAGAQNCIGIAENSSAPEVGFYGTTPTPQLTSVAVSAAGIHAALVTLGLIVA